MFVCVCVCVCVCLCVCVCVCVLSDVAVMCAILSGVIAGVCMMSNEKSDSVTDVCVCVMVWYV